MMDVMWGGGLKLLFVFGLSCVRSHFSIPPPTVCSSNRKEGTYVFERDECVSNSVLYINVHKVA